jgi:molybdate transport system substrate-binding protein
MTTAKHADACRLNTKELLDIAKGVYDDDERGMLERAIGELEGLAAAGSQSPAAGTPSGLSRHVEFCRLRTKALMKIAECIYDDDERLLVERSIGTLEELAIAAGPPSFTERAPSGRAPHAPSARPVVRSAISLGIALPDIQKSWEARTGRTVAFSLGASSVLAGQIESGGGADIFISANSHWMDELDRRGAIQRNTRVDLLANRLVLIAPAASEVSLSIGPHFDLAGALAAGRLAIADPASVPAGKYAKAALTALGVWDSIADHVAPAEDACAALAAVARGDCALGIVYATCAKATPKVRIVDTFPDDTHPGIVYPAALTKDADPQAKEFLDFLSGPEARAVFQEYGFLVPAASRGAAAPSTPVRIVPGAG